MPKNHMADKLKRFINKPTGRITVVVAIAAVLIIAAILPGMLPKNATESDHKLARSLLNLTKEPNTTVTGSASVVSSSINAKFDLNLGLKNAEQASGHISADIKFPGSTVKIPLDFVADSKKGDMYFKVSNTDGVMDTMEGGLEPYKLALSPIAVKINDKWIYVSNDKKNIIDPCTAQILDSFKSSKDMTGQLAAFIANNKALQITGVKSAGNASVYEMTFDSNKLDATFKDFKGTEMFKNLDKCSASYGEPEKTTTPQAQSGTQEQPVKTDTTIKITVDSNEKITNIEYKTTSNGSVGNVNLNLGYEKKVVIKTPTENIVKMDDIQSDLTRAVGLLMAPQLQAGNNMLSPYTQATNPSGQ